MDSPGHRRFVFALVITFYAVALLFSFHEADEDLWGRMAAGRLATSLGRVPEQDVFAFVPTKPLWVDHEWLSGLVFHHVYLRFGGPGLVVLRGVLGVAAVALVLGAARAGPPWMIALLAVSSGPLLAQGFNTVVRAQAFTFFFFALFLFVLERSSTTRGLLWLVPLTAIWANFHGGFVLGPLLALAWAFGPWLEGRAREAATLHALALGCFAASLLNPFGIEYWRYLRDALLMPRPEIVEWRSVALGDFHVLGSVLLGLILVVVKRPSPGRSLALIGAAAAALLHVRFAPLLGMVFVVTLAPSWESVFERARAPIALATMLLVQGLCLIGLFVFGTARDFTLELRVPEDRYPVEAISRLKREPPGNLAVFFNWGEYALYHLHPSHPVSIDGRYETVYPADVVRENWDFTRGTAGSEAFLDRYGAAYALYPRGSGAARYLAGSRDWRLLQRTVTFELYRRN